MKKTLLTLSAMVIAAGAFAQGTINFNNRIAGTLITHVYAPSASDPLTPVYGNSSIDTPAGATVYTGALLTGSGWTASLWSGVAGTSDESLLVLASGGGTTTFRTGTAAGNWAATTATLANVPKDAASAVLQVRIYPTSSGSWANALVLGTYGKSQLFTLASIGGDFNVPTTMTGLTSFSIVSVPEPSSMALAGLGAASLLIFRRRK